MDAESIDERLRAVERALTDGEAAVADLSDERALNARIDGTAERVDAVEERVAELEAAVQALRGYVGNVRSVNRDVERRAESAVATVETLGETVEDLEARVERLDAERRGDQTALEADGAVSQRPRENAERRRSRRHGHGERPSAGTGDRNPSDESRRHGERERTGSRAPHPIPACDCSFADRADGRGEKGLFDRLRAWL